MLLATARHPAMLYYLDNWQSQSPRDDLPTPPPGVRRPGLNENYGREVMWVVDDVMVVGYYNGGGRVVDVSGELRGDLYRQGREIARLWTGDPKGWRPNLPFTWGAQPANGLIYFNDINSGIWITRLPAVKSQTSGGQ